VPLPPVLELHMPFVMTEYLQRVSVTLHLTSSHARLASPPYMYVHTAVSLSVWHSACSMPCIHLKYISFSLFSGLLPPCTP